MKGDQKYLFKAALSHLKEIQISENFGFQLSILANLIGFKKQFFRDWSSGQGRSRLSEFRKIPEEIFRKSVTKSGLLKSQWLFSNFLQKIQTQWQKGDFWNLSDIFQWLLKKFGISATVFSDVLKNSWRSKKCDYVPPWFYSGHTNFWRNSEDELDQVTHVCELHFGRSMYGSPAQLLF